MKLRKEFDSIGSVSVPADKYWGASTQRSNKFFNIGKILVNISIIKSIAIIKRSAVLVHYREKQISKKITNSIIKASEEVIQGKLDENFPLKVWQSGSGTQTNMNVNEVIANRAIEILNGKRKFFDLRGNSFGYNNLIVDTLYFQYCQILFLISLINI